VKQLFSCIYHFQKR